MKKQENPINTILDLASEEVKGWPEWMRSNDHRREMERIEREILGIACPAYGSTKGTIITDPEICEEIVNEVKTKPVDAERKIREAHEFLAKIIKNST